VAIHGFIWQGVKYVAQTGIAGPVVGAAVTAADLAYRGGNFASTATGDVQLGGDFPMFAEGSDLKILSEAEARAMGLNGRARGRRRRRKLLTCGDKADIAFLHGNLGGGQLGRAAISSLLSRRCS